MIYKRYKNRQYMAKVRKTSILSRIPYQTNVVRPLLYEIHTLLSRGNRLEMHQGFRAKILTTMI